MADSADTGEVHRAIWRALSDGRPAVLTSHLRLDGDGAGSVLAFWHGLRMRGVDAYHVFEPPIPSVFEFLPGMQQRCAGAQQLPDAYHLVVLDCGTRERIGELADDLQGAVSTTNIDHHATNSGFGDINWVDSTASSCGEMMHGLLAAGDVPLTPEIAECLFAAIVSDTGRFSHEDTNPAAFAVCAECVRAGARPDKIIGSLFGPLSPAQVRLQQLTLASLRFCCGGRIATMEITTEMLEQTGLQLVDTEGFAELPIAIQGVQASALLKEMPGSGLVKVSMRCRGVGDVCAVARVFGGGGHVHAAGCEIADSLPNARQAIVARLRCQLQEQG